MPPLKSRSLIEPIGCREEATMRIAAVRDTLPSLPGSGAIKPMPEAEIARAVRLLDLMLNFFAHDGHWTRGSYDDRKRRPLPCRRASASSRKHRLPTASAIALLQEAMPRPGLPFNDTRCGSVAELRSVIVKARRLARDDAQRERAAAAVKTWLLTQIASRAGVGYRRNGVGRAVRPRTTRGRRITGP